MCFGSESFTFLKYSDVIPESYGRCWSLTEMEEDVYRRSSIVSRRPFVSLNVPIVLRFWTCEVRNTRYVKCGSMNDAIRRTWETGNASTNVSQLWILCLIRLQRITFTVGNQVRHVFQEDNVTCFNFVLKRMSSSTNLIHSAETKKCGGTYHFVHPTLLVTW